MPFRSKAQERFMFAQHPEIARKWVAEGYKTTGLPQRLRTKRYGISNLKRK